MPRTDLSSGEVSVSGTLSCFNNPGWHTFAGGSIPYAFEVHYDHPDSHYTQSVSLGSSSIHVSAYSACWIWNVTTLTWDSDPSHPGSIDGYPDALGTPPDPSKEYHAIARGFRVTRNAGDTSETFWIEKNHAYWISIAGGIDLSNNGGDTFELEYSISYDPIPLYESVSEITSDARAHATCVQQLRDNYWWQGNIDVSVSCEGTTNGSVSYNSISLPSFGVSMKWGEGGKWSYTTIPPPFKHYHERYSEEWSISFELSNQYGDGLCASGTEYKELHEDHACYDFGEDYISGNIIGETGQDEHYTGEWSNSEYIDAKTSFAVALQAFDQMTELSGLEATVTHFIDQEMDWDEDAQKYVQSSTYSNPRILSIPGTYTASFQRTSRHEDRIVPSGENDLLQATLTEDSLSALDLPLADNKMTLHDRALDAIGIDTSNWGAFDEHGGSYSGLVRIWVQSPLSVQWAQDDRESENPPSWWYNTKSLASIPRISEIEARIDFGGEEPISIRRDLVWHPTRRNEQWYGSVRPGIPESNLWMWIGDWHRLSSTKHLLRGEVIGGPFDMTSGNVTCDEDDPVDHVAYGVMPFSEDITDWRAYRYLKIIVSSLSPKSWVLTCMVNFDYDEVTDNYASNTEERREGFSCDTYSGTAIYSSVVESGGAKEILFDLMEASAPKLERVTSIILSGFPAGYENTLKDVQLIAPISNVWIESTDQRPVRYGGEQRYTCGSDPQYLGVAKTPEEYGGWWAVGGHTVITGVRDPGRTVNIAPNWGMPFVIRRVTSCGALQDELMDFSAWYGQRIGTWGLEGFYGKLHNGLDDPAMENWVDGDESALGCAAGTGWITHIPILYHYPIASQNLLSSGRNQDGGTDLPVIVRAGGLRLARGLNWASSSSGEAPVWGFKSILYGSRVEHVSSGSWRLTRAEPNQSCILYEKETDGDDHTNIRAVDTRVTDADGRLRFRRGINEFRHTEYGIEEEDCPDYVDRSDYLSDIIVPGESEADLVFSLHHYQVIPSSSRSSIVTPALLESAVLRTMEDTIFRANCGKDVGIRPGDDVIISRIGEGGIPSSRTVLMTGSASTRTSAPNLLQLGDGKIIFIYSQEQNTFCRTIERSWTEEEFSGGDDVMIEGVYFPSVYIDRGNNVVHCVGYDGTRLVYIRGNVFLMQKKIVWDEPHTIDVVDEQRASIVLLPDGNLLCTYVSNGGNEKERISSDHGETWDDW